MSSYQETTTCTFLSSLLWTASVSSGFWLLGLCNLPVTGLRTPMGHTICTEISCYHFFSHLFLCWCHHNFFATEVHDLNGILRPSSALLVALLLAWLVAPGAVPRSCIFLHTGRGIFFLFSSPQAKWLGPSLAPAVLLAASLCPNQAEPPRHRLLAMLWFSSLPAILITYHITSHHITSSHPPFTVFAGIP